MDFSLLGLYWHSRRLTLGGYKDFLRDVLLLLHAADPVFCDLKWVGNGKSKPASLASDLRNLDDLVYRYSWGKKSDLHGDRNPDGTPTWAAERAIGFGMMFDTGASTEQGGITISVRAGNPESFTPNAITISFPVPACLDFVYREFYSYDFLLDLFVDLALLSVPDTGLVTSRAFSKTIYGDGPLDVGWLTYFADDRCVALAEQFMTEETALQGTLFSLGRDSMFINTEQTVSSGRRLWDALKQLKVL